MYAWDSLYLSPWKLSSLAFSLQIITVCESTWRRKAPGLSGFFVWILTLCKALAAVVIVNVSGRRVRLLASFHAWCRRVDDTVDCTAMHTNGMPVDEYLCRKDALVRSAKNHTLNRVTVGLDDVLLLNVFRLADDLQLPVATDVAALWGSFRHDVRRLRFGNPHTRTALARIAHRWDRITLTSAVRVLGGDIGATAGFVGRTNAIFTRVNWLTGINEDLAHGLVNIPKEDLERYGIELRALRRATTWDERCRVPGFSPWYEDELKSLAQEWRQVRRSFVAECAQVLHSRWKACFCRYFLMSAYDKDLRLCLRQAGLA